MVFTVRCFKCGEHAARLVLGGRAILHARCQACDANLLAEVLSYEEELRDGGSAEDSDPPTLDEIDVSDLDDAEEKSA